MKRLSRKNEAYAIRYDSFVVQFPIVIRATTREDLPDLEWCGLYTEHRTIIRNAFRRQQGGSNVMLIAEANNFPAGQIWIDFRPRGRKKTALFWAFRVAPWLQDLHIGTRLLAVAERLVAERGFRYAELTVAETNKEATRLYHRLGYQLVGKVRDCYSYLRPNGGRIRIVEDQWLLRKAVTARTLKIRSGQYSRESIGIAQ